MARLAWVIGVPLGTLSLIGLLWGDPRAATELSRADLICGAAFVTAVAAALIAWRSGRPNKKTSGWWLPPTVILAISGGLCGWIAAAEFTYQPDVPVHLGQMPLRALYMVSATALGMALPALAVTGLASLLGLPRADRRGRGPGGLTPRGTART